MTRAGTLTVAGTTTSMATNVTLNTSNALLYADTTFAATNFTLANGNNTFTAIARDGLGRVNTNSLTVSLPETNSYAYDLNGNLLTNGTEVLVYNDENELVTNFVAGSWKSEFVYDGKLRRRIERDYSWSGSAWTQTNEIRFVYDGNVVIQHRAANNAPLLTLTRGIDLSGTMFGAGGIGGLLAMTEGSGVSSFYHADGNGNITALVNANQILVGQAKYDSFGNFISLSGAKAGINAYWFSSKPIHWQSGKYDFLYRWYVPNLQRWPNRDPLGEPGFEVLRSGQADLLGDGPNLYAYVKNNPVDRIDPLGLDGEATLAAEPTLLMDEEALAAYRAKQCRCAILAAAVQAAKKGVGAVGGVKKGDSCAVLQAKTAAWLVLAVARSRLNNVCFGGGNPTHQDEAAKAWAQVGEGIALQTEKGCVGSPSGGGGKR